MKISTILDQVENGTVTLPEFQRGYVWNRNQVRYLMQSLYRQYPVGGLLVWSTDVDQSMRRGGSGADVVKLLLDGQQRITSLYGVMRGRPPDFFQGSSQAFTNLYFNVRDETFEFYGPVKMRDDPYWVSVTDVYLKDTEEVLASIAAAPEDQLKYMKRLLRLHAIRDRDIYIDEITGKDRTIDEVVEIFNRVNSGGTKLSKGDLALARVAADRPETRNELRQMLKGWSDVGFKFELDWLLRIVTTISTGQAQFAALQNVSSEDFGQAAGKAQKAVDFLLNLISDRLGLDHHRVLGGRYALTALAPLVADQGGTIHDQRTQNQLLYWYIHTFMWGRYSGSTESTLSRDMEILKTHGVEGLIEELDRWRGTLRVRPEDLASSSVGSRFYPLLYMLSRVYGARDLGTGMELKAGMLGRQSALQVHHIFPKARLRESGRTIHQANAIANYAFLTASTNLAVGARFPSGYLPDVEANQPGVLTSQWIPTNPDLWELDRYEDFLAARRELMANAANSFLSKLLHDEAPATPIEDSLVPYVAATYQSEPEIDEVVSLVREHGFAEPTFDFEVVDEETGEVLAVVDAAWPAGLQPELSHPAGFLLEPDLETEELLSGHGYKFFTSVAKFAGYVRELAGESANSEGDLSGAAFVEGE